MIKETCTCGHSKERHDQESHTIREWEATPVEKRRQPLEFYLEALKNAAPSDTYCSDRRDDIGYCECKRYKQDNLRYLEEMSRD